MRINYELTVTEEETGLVLGTINAYSLESLEEQFHKVSKERMEARFHDEYEVDEVVGAGDEKQMLEGDE